MASSTPEPFTGVEIALRLDRAETSFLIGDVPVVLEDNCLSTSKVGPYSHALIFEKCIEHFLHTGFVSSHFPFVNKITSRKVVDQPTLTLLTLHAVHPVRDFLCVLCATGLE